MYDPHTNTITFPHVVPSPMLENKKITVQDIDGGAKPIADFGYTRNTFLGGNVTHVGLMTKYGFYACISVWNQEILGFLVFNPDMVTEHGKKVLKERFSDAVVSYERPAPKGLTAEEIAKRNELRELAINMGVAAEMVEHINAEGLNAMISAIKSGVNTKANVKEESVMSTPASENPEVVRPSVTGRPKNVKI